MPKFLDDPGSLIPTPASRQSLDTAFSSDERLLTAQEVAKRLSVSERWIRDHATRRSPRIRAVKLGPLLRFRWSDVHALVAELATHKPFKGR